MSERARSAIEQEFNEAMLSLYTRAKSEAHYNATRFLGMLSDLGGIDTHGHSFTLTKFPTATPHSGSVRD